MNLSLLLRDGTEYAISDDYPTVGMRRGPLDIIIDPIQKTFTDGALFNGERNAKASTITITLDLFKDVDADYRGALGYLARRFRQVEYIIDNDNLIRTRVELSRITEQATDDVGTVNRMGIVTFELAQLDPFWEDETATTIGPFNSASSNTIINNTGDLPCPLDLTVSATTTNATLSTVTLRTSLIGLQLSFVEVFASSEMCQFDVFNSEGAVIGISDNAFPGGGFDISNYIVNGSGYFNLPIGSKTFYWTLTGFSAITIEGSYRKRYYA